MSKIGVGIGEDFPVDDGKPRDERGPRPGFQGEYRPRDDASYDAEYAARREAHRKWREARREWKRQWRDEWRARRSEFRDQVRGSYYDGRRGHRRFGHPFFWGGLLWPILGLIVLIAVVSFAFAHIYFILGTVVLLALLAAAWHRGFDPFDLPPHYDTRPEQRPPQPPKPAEPPRDSAN
ncbi:MAG TPA: hypothetical protein VNU97_00510 [Rhizomicrobium sp.]|jgi:hypothetical protein|nr:hypothetical protein [Rhizomicrobium sp.]